MRAYTIGRDYDQALADNPVVRKTGRGDRAEALGYKTYAIELPGSWDECCYLGEDGVHHLLVDAVIVERVA